MRWAGEAVVAATAHTPIGKACRGAFNDTHGAELGGHASRHSVDRAGVEPGEVEGVLMGCAIPEGTIVTATGPHSWIDWCRGEDLNLHGVAPTST